MVGSGPGGMACADELAKLGYAVTIFEAQTRPGGLLVNGIPSFKLEKKIVERRFDLLRRRGVAVRCGVTVGRDISLSSLRENFDAVYLAIGAQKPKELDIPGADLRGVFHALPFLIQKNLGTSRPEFSRSKCAVNALRCWVAAILRWIVCGPRFAAARVKRSAFIDAISKTCRAAGANTSTRPRKARGSCFSPTRFHCQATPPAKFAKRAVSEWNWANRMRKDVANRAQSRLGIQSADRCRADRLRIRSGPDFRRRQFRQDRGQQMGRRDR